MKTQSTIEILLLAVDLIAQTAEFSTAHLSKYMLDSDVHSMQLSVIFSNLQSLACIFPLGPKECKHF
jgi:hypothetical protein